MVKVAFPGLAEQLICVYIMGDYLINHAMVLTRSGNKLCSARKLPLLIPLNPFLANLLRKN